MAGEAEKGEKENEGHEFTLFTVKRLFLLRPPERRKEDGVGEKKKRVRQHNARHFAGGKEWPWFGWLK